MSTTSIYTDRQALLHVLKHIEFTRNMMSEAEVIHSAENLLTKFSEFQSTFNSYNKSWNYYIRCGVRYAESGTPEHPNKLASLIESLTTLIQKGV